MSGEKFPAPKFMKHDKILAFDDIHPMAPVHVVIIPKNHISTLMDVDTEKVDIMNNLIAAAQKVAQIKGISEVVSAPLLTVMPREDR